jgi:hypothetical protein
MHCSGGEAWKHCASAESCSRHVRAHASVWRTVAALLCCCSRRKKVPTVVLANMIHTGSNTSAGRLPPRRACCLGTPSRAQGGARGVCRRALGVEEVVKRSGRHQAADLGGRAPPAARLSHVAVCRAGRGEERTGKQAGQGLGAGGVGNDKWETGRQAGRRAGGQAGRQAWCWARWARQARQAEHYIQQASPPVRRAPHPPCIHPARTHL